MEQHSAISSNRKDCLSNGEFDEACQRMSDTLLAVVCYRGWLRWRRVFNDSSLFGYNGGQNQKEGDLFFEHRVRAGVNMRLVHIVESN